MDFTTDWAILAQGVWCCPPTFFLPVGFRWDALRMAWPVELAAFDSLRASRAFFGVEDAVWTAFTRAAGGPGDDFRLLAALPPAAVAATTEAATLETGEHLTVVQAAQLGLVYTVLQGGNCMWTQGWTFDTGWIQTHGRKHLKGCQTTSRNPRK